MKTSLELALFLGLTVLVAACQQTTSQPASLPPEVLADIGRMKAKLERLQTNFISVSASVALLDLENKFKKLGRFDPTELNKYSRVDSETGTFLISLQNVTPFLNGQRITLSIGNPTTAEYRNFKLKLQWGPGEPNGKGAAETTKVGPQEKEVSVTESLKPGTWNEVTAVIAPAKADTFTWLNVGIETNEVWLRSTRGRK